MRFLKLSLVTTVMSFAVVGTAVAVDTSTAAAPAPITVHLNDGCSVTASQITFNDNPAVQLTANGSDGDRIDVHSKLVTVKFANVTKYPTAIFPGLTLKDFLAAKPVAHDHGKKAGHDSEAEMHDSKAFPAG